MRYVACTRDLYLILGYDGLKIFKWILDVAFSVHPDLKIHSGGLMMMSPLGGGMASGSTKQKLNTQSSTEAEIVSSDDFLSKIIWCKTVLHKQGVHLNQNILLQDNFSAKLLIERVRTSCGKRYRAINILYLEIKDYCD